MGTILFYFFVIFNLSVSLGQAEEILVGSGTGTFQLSLYSHKLGGDQWNTSYHLERSFSKTTKDWNLFLHQNVTDLGNVQHLELRGYFTVNANSSGTNGSPSFAVGRIPLDSVNNTSQEADSSGKCKEYTLPQATQTRIISRSEWGAQSGSANLRFLQQPVIRLDIYKDNPGCSNYNDCVVALKKLQENDILLWGDVYGNFHVAGDARIYEGIGWDRSHDSQLNLKYLTEGSNAPSPHQLASMVLLIDEGIRLGKISKNYTVEGSSSEITKKWINWIRNN